jgi:hypothetical protein
MRLAWSALLVMGFCGLLIGQSDQPPTNHHPSPVKAGLAPQVQLWAQGPAVLLLLLLLLLVVVVVVALQQPWVGMLLLLLVVVVVGAAHPARGTRAASGCNLCYYCWQGVHANG